MEDFKKKIEYIWYYYKVPIIIGLAVVIVIADTVFMNAREPKYDHSVAIISKYNYPNQENVDKLTKTFEDKTQGSVDIKIYNIALGEIGEDDVLISKLGLDIANKISEYYFIEDMDAFKKSTAEIEFSSVDLVSNLDWLDNLGLDNFYYCVRK